ncbi:MAG: ATP-binding protein [Candidatus Kapaibacterium sp.]
MLRVRLVLWYSLLVVLTITAMGLAQIVIINRSLVEGLDNSLMEDARITLHLINSLPENADPEKILQHGSMRSSGSLRDLIDHTLSEVPDSVGGEKLTDRVMAQLIDDMLAELSFQDSTQSDFDPMDAVVQRNLSSKRNNYVEIHLRMHHNPKDSVRSPVLFRTRNLGRDTLARLVRAQRPPLRDTSMIVGEIVLRGEPVRVARAASPRFVVYVAFPSSDPEDAIGRLQSSFIYLIPLSLLISTLGGLWLARKALRPIEQIADTAREIGAKNLSQRIELPAKRDRELGVLVETLNTMFARLEDSFDQIKRFTSDASHELKTPLAIMKGEIEQAQRHLEQANALSIEEGRTALESLMEEVERMQRIVEGLLLLSRADDKQLPLHKEPIRIYDYLTSLVEDGEILADERGLTLVSKFADDARNVVLNVDPTRLYQVVMNLLDNALKYTPRGGTVTMFARRSGPTLMFGISDTGMGIDAKDLYLIFRRFYRTDAARTGPREMGERSLGLGLAIVKSIVEAHDGTIEVESIKATGTTFTISLPIPSA